MRASVLYGFSSRYLCDIFLMISLNISHLYSFLSTCRSAGLQVPEASFSRAIARCCLSIVRGDIAVAPQ